MPTVSTTSVSPSHRPMEWPCQDGMQFVGGRVAAAVHEDLPVAVHRLVQDEDVRRRLDEAERVGIRARRRQRQTVQLRIILRHQRAHALQRLRQQRQRLALRKSLRDVADAAAAKPESGQIRPAVGLARQGTFHRLRGDVAAGARGRRRRLGDGDLCLQRRGEGDSSHDRERSTMSTHGSSPGCTAIAVACAGYCAGGRSAWAEANSGFPLASVMAPAIAIRGAVRAM